MPVQLQCPHKGCMKVQEAWLDPKNDKVYCAACEREIENINHFVKVQLKTLRQYRPKNTTAFSVKCGNCSKESAPVLKNNDVVCSSCTKPLNHLSPIFRNMLKDQLSKKSDIE